LGDLVASRGGRILGESMAPVLEMEKEWGVLGKRKIFESFRLSTNQRRIKGHGAPGCFGGYPPLSPI